MRLTKFIRWSVAQFDVRFVKMKIKDERLEWLEFHYEDLLQKYKLCMECMNKLKKENQELGVRNQHLMVSSLTHLP